MPWIIITIYHSLIYSTNIDQVSTMCQALVRTLGCSSQQDLYIYIRTTLHLRLYDYIVIIIFLFNLHYHQNLEFLSI